jgi:hypothetical protein
MKASTAMLNRRTPTIESAKGKMCLALLGVLGVFCSGAYAVQAADEPEDGQRAPRPTIVAKPFKRTWRTHARFAFSDSRPGMHFQCSLDRSRFRSCISPTRYRGPLADGKHTFRVRALGSCRRYAPSRAASYTWSVYRRRRPRRIPVVPQHAGKSFSIGAVGMAGPLYPGAAPQTIGITLNNPTGVSMFVTSLSVTVSSGPIGCDSARNIGLLQSDVSSLAPVEIRAHGSVMLPAQGRSAPTIRLVNLPVNQEACQSAHFQLSFTGSAHS